MTWSRRRALSLVLVAGGLARVQGIARADGIWLPPNYSTLGSRVDHLWQMIFAITTVAFILTEGALLYFVIRFRERPGHRAVYVHDSRRLEIMWWIIPGLVLLFLALYQWNTWADAKVRAPDPDESVRIEILAKQFEWNVRYPGPDGRFATGDDVALKNQVYIPEGKTILIQLHAEDVIHSFFLPNFRVKQDIVPGITTLVWFDALKAGKYEIACSELCGLGHYRMRGQLFVYSAAEFESWLQTSYQAGQPPSDWGWEWEEGI